MKNIGFRLVACNQPPVLHQPGEEALDMPGVADRSPLFVDPQIPEEGAETGQTGHGSRRAVRGPGGCPAWIGAADATPLELEPVALWTLTPA